MRKILKIPLLILALALLLAGCAPKLASIATAPAKLASKTPSYSELVSLPEPKGPIKVAVYSFRDQTGQYKPQANVSSFSTAVTQGANSLLLQALRDSRWFVPLEREGLQNLLTERKIIRATAERRGQDPDAVLPPLEVANLMLEGGIVGYDTNLVTGGMGAKYFGVGGDVKYRVDQVTVSLRAIDVRSGQVLKTVSTTKTVLSRELSAGIFRFIEFKRLLEAELGTTTNEPVQLAVRGAIEKAVSSLVIGGIMSDLWELKRLTDLAHPAIRNYLAEKEEAEKSRPIKRLLNANTAG